MVGVPADQFFNFNKTVSRKGHKAEDAKEKQRVINVFALRSLRDLCIYLCVNLLLFLPLF